MKYFIKALLISFFTVIIAFSFWQCFSGSGNELEEEFRNETVIEDSFYKI